MMPKPTFVKKVDNDNNDSKFKLVFRIRVVFAKDNQIHQSMIGHNVTGPLGEQKMLRAESLK